MRICDICHTPIPSGTDRCPNCGYRYRPEKKIGSDKNLIGEQLKKEQTSTMKHHEFEQHPIEQHPFDSPFQNFKKSFNNDDIFSVLKSTINQSAQKRRPNTAAAQNASKNIKKAKTVTLITLAVVTLITIIAMIIGIVFANVHHEPKPEQSGIQVVTTTKQLDGLIADKEITKLNTLVNGTINDLEEYYEYTEQEYEVEDRSLNKYSISSYGELGNVVMVSYIYNAYASTYQAKYLYVPIYHLDHEREDIKKAFSTLFDASPFDDLDEALNEMDHIHQENDYDENYTCYYTLFDDFYQFDIYKEQDDLGEYYILRILLEI